MTDDRAQRLEAARKEALSAQTTGAERYGVQAQWYEAFMKGKTTVPPKLSTPLDKPDSTVWLPLSGVDFLAEWFGDGVAATNADWRKGLVLAVDPTTGKEEIETVPTYSCVEIRTDEEAKEPLAKLERISALEEVPQLVRKALDTVSALSNVDEEDVRLWIRKSGEAEFHLCSSDEAKNGANSDPEEDLPEELVENAESTSLAKAVPTLRTVLGPSPPGQVIHILLELRDAEGKFPRKNVKVLSAMVTPRKKNGVNGLSDSPRPAAKSFSAAAGPVVGQMCDAQRGSDDRWLEARIVRVQGEQVTVHFLSFPSEMDETFPTSSPRIQPPHSRIPDWREQLKVGEEVDVHTYAFQLRRGGRLYKLFFEKAGTTAWVAGTVRKVERNVPEPRISIGVRFRFAGPESLAWVPLNSEKVAKRFTHIARPKSETYGPQNSQGAPPVNGVVGLCNLGNTCYMNSMLQCLSHCEVLREFFISGEYVPDLNLKNPLGTGGELANAFAEVLKEIWSGNLKVFAPKRFKQVLGQVNSQFQGYQQHDSQELLTLLADSLHEDLNRVRQKPATGPIEGNGRPDEVVAKESWETFKKRNDSKIVDEMYGLLKSHLVCNVCKKEAVKFDAYSNVSVPVPSTISTKLNVIFVDLHGQATRCVVSIPKRSAGRTLAEWLCKRFGVPEPEDLVVADMGYNETTFFYYHREAIQGGVVPTHGAVEGFDRKLIKDARETSRIIAWQLPSKAECHKRAKQGGNPASFESKWTAFFKELGMVAAAASSSATSREQILTRSKDLLSAKYLTELSGPFPVAQRRLAKGLATIKNPEIVQALAREALRLGETVSVENAFANCISLDPDLVREANVEDGNSSLNGEQGEGTSSDASSSTTSKQSLPKRAVSSPFRLFRAATSKANGSSTSNNNSSNSPQVPTRTLTPPAGGSGSSTTLGPPALPLPVAVDPQARIPIEVRHFRTGFVRGRRARAPFFLVATMQSTCDDLRADIDQYLARYVLGTFNPAEQDQNSHPSPSSAAADAAQLELNSQPPKPVKPPHLAAAVNGNGVSSFSSVSNNALLTTYYTLEVEGEPRVKLPAGPVTIGESLAAKYPINAIVILVHWKDGLAADHVYRTIEQDDANPEKYTDADLGLGKIVVDATCKPPGEGGLADGTKQAITLQQCLDVFRQREQLGEDDPWFCDQCKAHRCAFKTMDLWDTPRILVIHLKRFLYEKAGGAFGERVQRDKITDLVKFPMKDFDVSGLLAKAPVAGVSTKYDLFAVSNHMGGLGGGHYTAYIKAKDESWWLMNDGICTMVDKAEEESQVVSPNAYVLFYRRKD